MEWFINIFRFNAFFISVWIIVDVTFFLPELFGVNLRMIKVDEKAVDVINKW